MVENIVEDERLVDIDEVENKLVVCVEDEEKKLLDEERELVGVVVVSEERSLVADELVVCDVWSV